MKKMIFAAAMAICLMAGTSVFAQNPKAPMPKQRPTAEQMAQHRTERMTEKLQLNEAQSKQLYELNLQEVKDMQAQREKMIAARKAQDEKMKGILTPEQYEQWKQMQGPKPGMRHGGPHMKDGKMKDCAGCGDCDAPCKKDGKKCDKSRSGKQKK